MFSLGEARIGGKQNESFRNKPNVHKFLAMNATRMKESFPSVSIGLKLHFLNRDIGSLKFNPLMT